MLRTDLAIEAKELYHENIGNITEIDGVKARCEEMEDVTVTYVEVINEEGSKSIGKPVGNYYTIEMPKFRQFGYAYYYLATELLSAELKKVLPDMKNRTALVIGLGNRHITSDALGSLVVDKLIITRHLFGLYSEQTDKFGSLCAVAPSVLGLTGIETAEIVKGICQKVKPGVVILVDALASRKTDRVATTIQMSDTGLNPGAGIGNHRKEITEAYLDVPVISIGVPMVVDVLTIAHDAVSNLGISVSQTILDNLTEKKQGENTLFIVTPKDVDKLTSQMANVISSAINITFHDIKIEDIESYLG